MFPKVSQWESKNLQPLRSVICDDMFSSGHQVWKLEGKILKNRADFTISRYKWYFEPATDSSIYICNNQNTLLSVNPDGTVCVNDFKVVNVTNQMWIHGKLTNDNYFTIGNVASGKLLTAIDHLVVEGKLSN